MPEALQILPVVDPTTPGPARMYDYYLAGTHHLQVDRDLADNSDPRGLVARYMAAVAPGSYLVRLTPGRAPG